MPGIRSILAVLALGAAFAGTSGAALASQLVIDRGLPDANLNSAAGASRSNVAWDFQGYGWMAGDDFTVPTGVAAWRIDSIRTWVVAGTSTGAAAANNNTDTGDDNPYGLGDTFASLDLYIGTNGSSALTSVSSGSFAGPGSNATDNPDISISRIQYNSAEPENDYQGSSTSYIQMFEVEFSNLNLWVEPGSLVNFAVDGLGPDDNAADPHIFTLWLNHASNAGLSGSAQDGADDLYKAIYLTEGGAQVYGPIDSDGFGWDKSSDINVQVFATEMPEPGTIAVFGLGVVGLAAFGRRRAAKAAR